MKGKKSFSEEAGLKWAGEQQTRQAGSALAFVTPPLAQVVAGVHLNCLPSNVFISGWQRSSGCLISKWSGSQTGRCLVTKCSQSWENKAESDRLKETVTDFFLSRLSGLNPVDEPCCYLVSTRLQPLKPPPPGQGQLTSPPLLASQKFGTHAHD